MHFTSKIPAAMTGIAMAAATAGTVAYVMNHTTPAQRRRAIHRTASRMSAALDHMADDRVPHHDGITSHPSQRSRPFYWVAPLVIHINRA